MDNSFLVQKKYLPLFVIIIVSNVELCDIIYVQIAQNAIEE